MKFSKIMYRDAREYEGIHSVRVDGSYLRTGRAQHYHSPHNHWSPNSFEGPSLEGLANHTRTGLLLPFSGVVRTSRLGYRLNKRPVQGYCNDKFMSYSFFGRCGARDVHFDRGGSDLIAASQLRHSQLGKHTQTALNPIFTSPLGFAYLIPTARIFRSSRSELSTNSTHDTSAKRPTHTHLRFRNHLVCTARVDGFDAHIQTRIISMNCRLVAPQTLRPPIPRSTRPHDNHNKPPPQTPPSPPSNL